MNRQKIAPWIPLGFALLVIAVVIAWGLSNG